MISRYSVIKSFLSDNSINKITVQGNSMKPLLTDGQRVKVIPLKNLLIPGKCYIFVQNNLLCIHRLVKIKSDKAYFIGDKSQKIDIVHKDAIVAELELNQNYIVILLFRYVNLFFNKICNTFYIDSKLRIYIFYLINTIERFFYERKIHKTCY